MHFYSVAALLGRPVEDVQGRTVGSIDDLLVDRADGHVAYVRLNVSAGLVPEDLLTVPWCVVRPPRSSHSALRIAVTGSTLRRLASRRAETSL